MSNLLLDNATSTGTGTELDVRQLAPSVHTLQVELGGTVVATAVTIDLEGSLDGKKWFQLAEHILSAAEITAEQAMFHVVDKVVHFVRANLTTLTGGTAPTITARYVAERRSTQ